MDLNCSFERLLWRSGVRAVAGIDEAGRGPLAGPVVAAAVIFPPEVWIEGVDDSKKLTQSRREELAAAIRGTAIGIGIGIVASETIDRVNILEATMEAMGLAVDGLGCRPGHLLVDGNRFTSRPIPATTIVGGDAKCHAVAAASIVAKVTRDAIMREYAVQWPEYGFERHKGYGTTAHIAALKYWGPSPIHRTSFRLPAKESDHAAWTVGGGSGGPVPAGTGI